MGKLSTYLANELLDHVFNAAYTPASSVYLGLSTANPGDTGSTLAEPSGNGYARQPITFGAAANLQVMQSASVTFPQATAAWGTITHWAVFDAVSAGNMLAHGELGLAKAVVSGNTLTVPSAQVYVGFVFDSEMSQALIHNLLNLAFRNVAYAKPDTYVGVAIATLSNTTTGSTVTEPSGGSYARVQVNPNGGSAPAWSLAASRALASGAVVDMPTATAGWGTVYASFIASALTGGDILFFDNGTADQAVSASDMVQFASGAITASIN